MIRNIRPAGDYRTSGAVLFEGSPHASPSLPLPLCKTQVSYRLQSVDGRGYDNLVSAAMPPWQALRAQWFQAHNRHRSTFEFQPNGFFARYVHLRIHPSGLIVGHNRSALRADSIRT
jgi:hypothetical protein